MPRTDDQISERTLKRWEEERIQREAFEDREFLHWQEPGNDALDRTPERIDLLTDQMSAEDLSTYAEDGQVR